MDEQQLLGHLRHAVAAGEIWPALQPQVDLQTRQITGFEGYMESAACGLLAARNIYARLEGKELPGIAVIQNA